MSVHRLAVADLQSDALAKVHVLRHFLTAARTMGRGALLEQVDLHTMTMRSDDRKTFKTLLNEGLAGEWKVQP